MPRRGSRSTGSALVLLRGADGLDTGLSGIIFFAVTEISDSKALFAAMFSRRRRSNALRPSLSFLGAMIGTMLDNNSKEKKETCMKSSVHNSKSLMSKKKKRKSRNWHFVRS